MNVFKTTAAASVLLGFLSGCDGSQPLWPYVDAGVDATDASRHDVSVADARHDSLTTPTDASEGGSKPEAGDAGCVSGGSCTPTNACDEGVIFCSSGAAACADTGQPVADGSVCGTGFVCSAGQCNACATGAACSPNAMPCHLGATVCTSGSPVCADMDDNVGNGVPCGTGHVCEGGRCVLEAADAGTLVAIGWCNVQWPPMIPDEAASIPLPRAGAGLSSAIYARVFAPGVTTVGSNQGLLTADIGFGPVGGDPTNAAQASQWSWQPMTFNPSCSGCGQNYEYQVNPTAPSTAGVYAYAARFSGNGGTTFAYCAGPAGTSSGQAYDTSVAPTMTVAGSGCQQVGAACGGDGDCCAGSGSCWNSLCTCPGVGGTCTPTDACHEGRTACAAGEGPACQDTGTAVADGTICGTDMVCMTGTCSASTCAAGSPCVPANPCDLGVASCNGDVPACNDTGNEAPNGTSCGTGKSCNAGVCASCAAGTACTPANVCHVGSTDCSSGRPVCTDTGANVANGTSCGTGEVCLAGSCGCTAGLTSCPPNGCIDLTTNSDDCKVCGNACGSGSICIASACTTPPALPVALDGFAAVLGPDGQVYVLGGEEEDRSDVLADGLPCGGTGPASTVYVYSPVTNVWSTAPAMTTARMNHGAALGADGRIYVLGGTGSGGVTLDSVEIYDVTAKAWSPGPPMLAGSTRLGAALGTDGRIYAIGGVGASSGQPTLGAEALDTTTGAWSSIASLPMAANPTVVLSGATDDIYTFAFGPGGVPTLMIYDVPTGAWSTSGMVFPVLGLPYYYSSGAVLPNGNFLLQIDDGGSLNEYNPATGSLMNGPPTYRYPNDAQAVLVGLPNARILAIGVVIAIDNVCGPEEVFLYEPVSSDWIFSAP